MLESRILPPEIKELYPFSSQHLTLGNGHRLHYIDQGQGPVVFLVHGNPTWSFYYRNLILRLQKNYRVIALDHLGCGLSDKPQDYDYTLKNHIDNLEQLKDHLAIERYNLVVHDWGGAIGCGMATRAPKQLDKLVILNTAAFTSEHIPWRINICRTPFIGEKLIRHFNGFAWPATFMAVKNKLSRQIKRGYLFPYHNSKTRIATARFVQDIPMNSDHPSYCTLKEIENKLPSLNGQKLILWGEKDFCFHMEFLKRWREIYPQAQVKTYQQAGHYVIEDAREDVIDSIDAFLKGSPNA